MTNAEKVFDQMFNGRRRGWQKVVEGVIWIGFHLLGEARVDIDFRVTG